MVFSRSHIYDMLSQFVLFCNEEGRILFANVAVQQWHPKPLIGQSFFDLLLPENIEKGRLFFQEVSDASHLHPIHSWELIVGYTNEYIVATFSGYNDCGLIVLVAEVESSRVTQIHQQMLAITSELANVQRKLQIQNVTLLKRAEEVLHAYQQEIDYQKLALDEHCIVCILDKKGKITYVNQKFCIISHYSREELIGKDMRIVDSGMHTKTFYRSIWKTIAKGCVWHGELIKRNRKGKLYVLDSTIVPFLNDAQKPYQYVLICTDITALKYAREFEKDRNLVLEMIARDQELKDILKQIALMIKHQQPDVMCFISLLKDGTFHYETGSNFSLDIEHVIKTFRPDLGSCPAYGAVQIRESTMVCNILTTPMCQQCHKLAWDFRLQSCWNVPIMTRHQEVVGMITILHPQEKEPSTQAMQIVDNASHLAGIAIEQRLLSEKLAYQSFHDTLTNLPNRLLFEDRLQQTIALAKKKQSTAAVVFVDLDRFKQVNNTLGHAMGDQLLQQVARRFEEHLREGDTLARMGSDEFAFILTNLEHPHDMVRFVQRVRDSLRSPFYIKGYDFVVNVSIGIALYPDDGQDVTTLLRNGDTALCRAKIHKNDHIQFFASEMNEVALRQLELETHLHYAIEREELSLHYQPQVDLEGNLVGVEALLRWNNPRLGRISPATFIPLAEQSGLIVPIGEWVLQEACHQAKQWQKVGYAPFKVAVNVSAIQIAKNDFVEIVARTLFANRLDARWLELELTESMFMQNYTHLAQQLEKLRSLGVCIAIDDFGTGYSSLSHLQKLPIDTLKIDQSFVSNIGSGSAEKQNGLSIVRTIVMLARSLEMHVLAEGVETPEQLDLLRSIECDMIQGRLFSGALPAHELEALLRGAKRNDGMTIVVGQTEPSSCQTRCAARWNGAHSL